MADSLFVVVLIETLEGTTIDQKRLEALLGTRNSRKNIHSQVNRGHKLAINCRLLFGSLVHHLDHISVVAWDFRASQELGGIFLVRLIRSEKGDPIGMKLDQDGIGNFARQGTIGV